MAVDQGPKGRCVKGSPCDGFPCKVRAKGDAENRILRPLLLKKEPWLELRTACLVERLETDASGEHVVAALVRQGGELFRVEGGTFVVAAGAVNSAVLLLRSANERWPGGLANSSGLVGRHFMAHNNTVVMALSPFRRNPTLFQKTLALHDYYTSEGPAAGPSARCSAAARSNPRCSADARILFFAGSRPRSRSGASTSG